MEETLKLRLVSGPDAAARARASLVALNSALSRFRDVVRLLVSELVTNSVRHSGEKDGPIEIELCSSPKGVRVQVTDTGTGFEDGAPTRPNPEHEGGYGLYLVEQLSDRWGTVKGPPARVWFEIDQESGTRP